MPVLIGSRYSFWQSAVGRQGGGRTREKSSHVTGSRAVREVVRVSNFRQIGVGIDTAVYDGYSNPFSRKAGVPGSTRVYGGGAIVQLGGDRAIRRNICDVRIILQVTYCPAGKRIDAGAN